MGHALDVSEGISDDDDDDDGHDGGAKTSSSSKIKVPSLNLDDISSSSEDEDEDEDNDHQEGAGDSENDQDDGTEPETADRRRRQEGGAINSKEISSKHQAKQSNVFARVKGQEDLGGTVAEKEQMMQLEKQLGDTGARSGQQGGSLAAQGQMKLAQEALRYSTLQAKIGERGNAKAMAVQELLVFLFLRNLYGVMSTVVIVEAVQSLCSRASSYTATALRRPFIYRGGVILASASHNKAKSQP